MKEEYPSFKKLSPTIAANLTINEIILSDPTNINDLDEWDFLGQIYKMPMNFTANNEIRQLLTICEIGN
jgi:hypothetical protein